MTLGLVTRAKSGLRCHSIVGSQLLSTFPCSSVALALQPNIRWYAHEFGPVFCGSDKVRLYYFWFIFTQSFQRQRRQPCFLLPWSSSSIAAAMGCDRQPFGWHVMPAGLEGLVASTTVGEETASVRSKDQYRPERRTPRWAVWSVGGWSIVL